MEPCYAMSSDLRLLSSDMHINFEHEESGAKMTSPTFLGLVVIVTVKNSCTSRPIRNTGL